MVAGGTTDNLGNFLGWWEKLPFEKNSATDIQFTITLFYAYRPDKIAYEIYGREDYQWLVLQYNNIVDINEELSAGKIIVLPSYDRAMYSLTND